MRGIQGERDGHVEVVEGGQGAFMSGSRRSRRGM